MKYFLNISLLRRNRRYRLLFIGQFISFFGTMITNVALPYQIYHLTLSTLMVGLLSLIQLLPLLVTALLGGVLADRYPRRKLLLIAESVLAIGCLLLAFNAFSATPKIWVLFVVAFFMSALNGLHRPAMESIVQQLVEKKDFSMVGALVTFKYSICMIVGPAIGGLLIARFGVGVTYLVDFCSFLLSVIALLLLGSTPPPSLNVQESTFTALTQGFRYAATRQELLGSYFVDFIAMVFGMPIALFPAIAQFHGGARTLGLLYSAPAVGALIIAFFSGWTLHIRRHGRAIVYSAALWGIAIIFFGLSTKLTWALFFLAWAGAFDAISGLFRQVLWNQTIPTEFRGRLAGIEMISYLSGPKLGDTEAGLVAAAFGITFSIISGGVLCVVGVAVCCYYLPKFWHYQSPIWKTETN